MLRFAVRNLLSRPLRSLLALLGLTVAIVGMISLFAVAAGLDRMVETTFTRMPGLVALQPGAPIPLFSKIPASWADEARCLPGVRVVQQELWARAHLIEGKLTVSPPRFLYGVDLENNVRLEHNIYREEMVVGRYLSPEDRGTNNAVISVPIAEEFRTSVGGTLHVDGYDLTIVGIYHARSVLLDVAILADLDVVRQIARFDDGWTSALYIEPDDSVPEKQLVAALQQHFRGRDVPRWNPSSALSLATGMSESPLQDFFAGLDELLKRGPSGTTERSVSIADSSKVEVETDRRDTGAAVGDAMLEIRAASDWGERVDEFSADLNIFLLLMTSIGVVIAVLSILNTMWMSVSERIVEFGVLKANGWSRRHVLQLVCWESALLGITGGLAGAVGGWGVAQLINWYWGTRVYLYAGPGLLLFGIAFSTVLGILGGLYPALWGARLTPMDAIRRG